MYDRFPWSPHTFASSLTNFTKVILLPNRAKSRITHELNLYSNDFEKFEELRKKIGDKNLPEDMIEAPVEIYSKAFESS
jgi:hypothetical protein